MHRDNDRDTFRLDHGTRRSFSLKMQPSDSSVAVRPIICLSPIPPIQSQVKPILLMKHLSSYSLVGLTVTN